jgi:hypothetical protein
MEHFGAFADHQAPARKIVEEVERADAYVGIFGMRYGSVDEATGLSMTELEFRAAETKKMPMLLYVIRDDAQVRADHIETDSRGMDKLKALKSHILTNYVAYRFLGADDLARQIFEDLGTNLGRRNDG